MPHPSKGKKFAVEILTQEEFELLLRQASNRAPTGVRTRALLVVLYRGGLRVSEALQLYPKDVALDAGEITVLSGKGGRRRVAALDAGACAIVSRWMEVRSRLGLKGRQPLFCSITDSADRRWRKGRPLSRVDVWKKLRSLAARAGIEKRVHPHGLRHAHAVALDRAGLRAVDIQEQLGHTSLATTQVYLNHLTGQPRIQAVREVDWNPIGKKS